MKESESKSGYEQGCNFYNTKIKENIRKLKEATTEYDQLLIIEDTEMLELKLAQLTRREQILGGGEKLNEN